MAIGKTGTEMELANEASKATSLRQTIASHLGMGTIGKVLTKRPDIFWSTIAMNIVQLMFPLFVLQIYDRIIPFRAMDTLFVLASLVVLAIVADYALKTARMRILGRLGMNYKMAVVDSALQRLYVSALEEFEKRSPGAYLHLIQSADRLKAGLSGNLGTLAIDVPFTLIFLIGMAVIAGWLVFIPLVLISLFLLYVVMHDKQLTTAIENDEELQIRWWNFLLESLSGINLLKSQSMEPFLIRRSERLLKQRMSAEFRLARLSTTLQNISQLFLQLNTVAVIGIGGIFVASESLSFGSLAASIFLSARIIQPVLRSASLWATSQRVGAAIELLKTLESIQPQSTPATAAETKVATITAENIAHFNPSGERIFDIPSFAAKPGEITGIMSRNGTGKTLFLRTLSGHATPEAGSVHYQNADGETVDAPINPPGVIYVPSFPELFQGTVLDNLSGFREENRGRAMQMSVDLGLGVFFSQIPYGLGTEVGPSSTGSVPFEIQQAICITRALVSEPSVLLLDSVDSTISPALRKRLSAILNEMAKDGLSVVWTSVSKNPATHKPWIDSTHLYTMDEGRLTPLMRNPRGQA